MSECFLVPAHSSAVKRVVVVVVIVIYQLPEIQFQFWCQQNDSFDYVSALVSALAKRFHMFLRSANILQSASCKVHIRPFIEEVYVDQIVLSVEITATTCISFF